MLTNSRIFCTYLLQLEGHKHYYAGSTLTNNLHTRYLEHCEGTGAHWTYLHKPVKILQVWKGLTSSEAFNKEQELAEEYIIRCQNLEACRGGFWNFPPHTSWWVPRRLRHLIISC